MNNDETTSHGHHFGIGTGNVWPRKPSKHGEVAMPDLLNHEEIETLFRVEASLRDKRNHWLYGKRISALLEQGLLVESEASLKITPKGQAHLLMARDGPVEN